MTLALALTFLLAQSHEDLPTLSGEAKARIQNIDQALEDWDIDEAKVQFEALTKLTDSDSVQRHYYAGRIAFEEGRYAEAATELEAAGMSGSKPDSWLGLAKATRDITEKAVKTESEHFIVLTPPGKDAVLVPWALEALENQRAALEHDLGYAPPGKVRIEFVSSAKELSKVSTLSLEAIKTTGTIAICKFNKLMVTSPKAVVYGYDWLDTVSHEYVHLVVSKKSRNTVPIWMHEGLAKYLESRWRGPAGGAMTPPSLALLGSRVRANKLVTFQQMYPSMALLPTAEDAATAFSEVFFAIKLIEAESGPNGLERMLSAMAKGSSDKAAVELVMRRKWADFEKAWMAYLKKQPFPKDLLPPSSRDRKELAENASEKKQPKRQISFGDFVEVTETDARQAAHLGELMREKERMAAAAEEYEKAYRIAGDKYESVSNKYALTLMELGRLDEALRLLEASLLVHPGSAATNVHLARIALLKKDWARAFSAMKDAMAVNPFDPEVHLALHKAAVKLNDQALAERTADAVALLLNIKDKAKLARALERLGTEKGLLEPIEEAPTPDAGARGTVDPKSFMMESGDGGYTRFDAKISAPRGTKIFVNDKLYGVTEADGLIELNLDLATDYIVVGKRDGFIDSAPVSLNPNKKASVTLSLTLLPDAGSR